ncbi:hypothetical protein Drorol1_Dr00017077, partial [Drosera rotundifolia]
MAAIFSVSPITFNLGRKSQEASDLKRSISDELRRHFVDHYSDDVLADYITVLVCNGKNQNQAKDDLDAFLGEKSVVFVSWLWNFLLENERKSKSSASSKQLDHSAASSQNTKDVQKSPAEHISELQGPTTSHICNSLILEGKESTLHDSYQYTTTVTSEGLHPVKDISAKRCINKKEFRSIQSCPHVNVHLCPCHAEETPKVDEFQKLTNEKCNDLPHVCSSLPRKDSASRNTLSDASHSSQCRVGAVERSDSHGAIAPICQSNRIRRSVWDRLGPSMVSNLGVNGSDSKVHDEEPVGQHLSLPVAPSGLYNGIGETGELSKGGRTIAQSNGINRNDGTVPGAAAINKIGQKRQFDEVTTGPGASVMKKSVDSSCEEIAQAGKRQLSAVKRPQVSSVHNVKARLQQIEKEMSKLQEKHVEKEKQGSQILGSKSGSQKPLEEDIESRSVLVTNVHFVATKEALSLFFGKCGRIAGVFIVSDDGSFLSRRPRSACITFANKESADKALYLSGMAFYSRNIKVERLADKLALSSLPIPSGAKPAESEVPQIKKSIKPNIPLCPSSRLQWQRESAGSVSSVPPAGSINQPKVFTVSISQSQQYVAPPLRMREKSREQPRKSSSDKSGDEISASLPELYVAPPSLMKQKLGVQPRKSYSDKAGDETSPSLPELFVTPSSLIKEKSREQQQKSNSDKARNEMPVSLSNLSVAPPSLMKEMSVEQQKKSNSDEVRDETSASLPELYVAPPSLMKEESGEQQQKSNSENGDETLASLPVLYVAPSSLMKENSEEAANSGGAQNADIATADAPGPEQQYSSSLISLRT